MAWELESLIADLFLSIACAGEAGLELEHLLQKVRHVVAVVTRASTLTAPSARLGSSDQFVQHASSTLWAWITEHQDVSVGFARKFNHLTWEDTSSLLASSNTIRDGRFQDQDVGKVSQIHASITSVRDPGENVKVYASERLQWECLTGHDIDHKRIPRSEWLLLLGIASKLEDGILQGDLGRLTAQDKRSVPKRTDSLAIKGYIIKRTTLVRGTKTSKMWLRAFVPVLLEDDADDDEGPAMVFSRENLVANRDPVPWHSRWTQESIDYKALATTIMALAREWGVLRMQDLKAKLGVLGSRWHMKVLATVCRQLNRLGVIAYVAAKLEKKVFKDCVRYVRDMSVKDWNHFLSTGKRTSRQYRSAEWSTSDDAHEYDLGRNHSALTKIYSTPAWSVDKPILGAVATIAASWGPAGISNPALSAVTLGPTFARFITSATTSMSTPGIQPHHLEHLQMARSYVEKGTSFGYFVPSQIGDAIRSSVGSSRQTRASRDFPPVSGNIHFSGRHDRLQKPRAVPSLQQKARSLPNRAANLRQTALRTPPRDSPSSNGKATASCPAFEKDKASVGMSPALDAVGPATSAAHGYSQTGQDLGSQGALAPSAKPNQPNRASSVDPNERCTLFNAVVNVDATTPDNYSSLTSSTAADSRVSCHLPSNACTPLDTSIGNGLHVEETPQLEVSQQAQQQGFKHDKPDAMASSYPLDVEKASGGSRNPNAAKKFVCDKCGGIWKNDVGLKYHQQKSKTSCNPSFILPQTWHQNLPRSKLPGRSRTPQVDGELPDFHAANLYDKPTSTSIPFRHGHGKHANQRQYSLGTVQPVRADFKTARVANADTSRSGDLSALIEAPQPYTLPGELHASLGPSVEVIGQKDDALIDNIKRQHLFQDHREAAGKNGHILAQPNQRLPDSPARDEAEYQGRLYGEAAISVARATASPQDVHDQQAVTPPAAARHGIHEDLLRSIWEILEIHGGCFVGMEGLTKQVFRRSATDRNQSPYTLRVCKMQIQRMLRQKVLVEHWHGFRIPSGKFERCQVVSFPNLDAFSAPVLEAVKSYQNRQVGTFYKEAGSNEERIDSSRGRRPLPPEIVRLDAPVYIAQEALKRPVEEVADGMSSNKRVRLDQCPGVELNQSQATKTTHGIKYRRAAYVSDDPLEGNVGSDLSVSNLREFQSVRFLPPNSHLGDGLDTTPGPPVELQGQCSDSEVQPLLYELSEPIEISPDAYGNWPWLDIAFFDNMSRSITLRGRWPDRQWLLWEKLPSEIEKRVRLWEDVRRSQSKKQISGYEKFLEFLIACKDAEAAFDQAFGAPESEIVGPNLIFIGMTADWANAIPGGPKPLQWVENALSTPGNDFYTLTGASTEADEDLSPTSGDDDVRSHDLLERLECPLPPTSQHPKTVKRVLLQARRLTALPRTSRQDQPDGDENHAQAVQRILYPSDELIAAFVAVRVLLGGVDKSIDWGLLTKIFPRLSLRDLRCYWVQLRKSGKTHLLQLTQVFQERVMEAFQSNELPLVDFRNVEKYDWKKVIQWTLTMAERGHIRVPSTKIEMNERYGSYDRSATQDEWLERIFHPQTSVFARFEDLSSSPAVFCSRLRNGQKRSSSKSGDKVSLVRSWIRSLSCTEKNTYSSFQIKERLFSLFGPDSADSDELIGQALDQLVRDRVVQRDRCPVPGTRPYRLHDWVKMTLKRNAHRTKYSQARYFKRILDRALRRDGHLVTSYNLDDGTTMALTHLCAYGRVRLVPLNIPHIPLGFEPGNYEIRKLGKSYYRFDVDIRPTDLYQYDTDIPILRSIFNKVPTEDRFGRTPQWLDFFGNSLLATWANILGAVCFTLSTRGYLDQEQLCSSLNPVLEPFEISLIIQWSIQNALLKDTEACGGNAQTLAEWWWLAIGYLQSERDELGLI